MPYASFIILPNTNFINEVLKIITIEYDNILKTIVASTVCEWTSNSESGNLLRDDYYCNVQIFIAFITDGNEIFL